MIPHARGDATGKREVFLMKPSNDSVREILKGLEGLEMLGQWELSLTRDLHTKAEALLQSEQGGPSSDPDAPDGPPTPAP
jgi:hypothetical protein